jgi:cathepsin C
MDGDEYHTSYEKEGGHAVALYGWGERNGIKYWNFRNSWGGQWGTNGNGKMERGINAWGVESSCSSAKVTDYSGGRS